MVVFSVSVTTFVARFDCNKNRTQLQLPRPWRSALPVFSSRSRFAHLFITGFHGLLCQDLPAPSFGFVAGWTRNVPFRCPLELLGSFRKR